MTSRVPSPRLGALLQGAGTVYLLPMFMLPTIFVDDIMLQCQKVEQSSVMCCVWKSPDQGARKSGLSALF